MPAILKSLRYLLKIGKGYVAVENGEIVGAVLFRKEQYWDGPMTIIEELAVKDSHKGMGLGKQLVQKAEKTWKVVSVMLVTHPQAKAVEFYKKLGYNIESNSILMGKKIRK